MRVNRDDVLARLDELERDHRKDLALISELREAISATPAADGASPRRNCPHCGVVLLLGVSLDVSRTGFDGDRVSWVTRSLQRA